ncbi:unnamed protein product [Closterium sp. NIES-65]|nr:unnamed protein product [Closterium sp. NIES-65]
MPTRSGLDFAAKNPKKEGKMTEGEEGNRGEPRVEANAQGAGGTGEPGLDRATGSGEAHGEQRRAEKEEEKGREEEQPIGEAAAVARTARDGGKGYRRSVSWQGFEEEAASTRWRYTMLPKRHLEKKRLERRRDHAASAEPRTELDDKKQWEAERFLELLEEEASEEREKGVPVERRMGSHSDRDEAPGRYPDQDEEEEEEEEWVEPEMDWDSEDREDPTDTWIPDPDEVFLGPSRAYMVLSSGNGVEQARELGVEGQNDAERVEAGEVEPAQ